jgi:hypothetical protein
MNTAHALVRTLGDSRIWTGHQLADIPAERSGYSALDKILPGRGWPLGALSEILHAQQGIGELSLLLPTLARLTQAGRRVALIDPPHIPYAPALSAAGVPLERLLWLHADTTRNAQWAAEQMLRSGAVGAVLMWSRIHADSDLRRLQLAAESSQSLAFLYRPLSASRNASPAALRLSLTAAEHGLRVQLLKVKGGREGATAFCPLLTHVRIAA